MLSKLFSNKSQGSSLEWRALETEEELVRLEEASRTKAVLIFKHSTRCGISAMALSRFERDFDSQASFDPYYLDLITYRDLSNEIASRYGVVHQSPQTLLLVNGSVVHTASHNGIDFGEVNNVASEHI